MNTGDFRNRMLAQKASAKINQLSQDMGNVRIMHVCGTHEDTISRFGIRSLLPDNVEIVSGPGCPVCVTTTKEVDEAIFLAKKGITVTTFGDMLKVPGSNGSLADIKAQGYDVRVVYSITDSIKLAENNPSREVVHLAIGFETTAPSTASAVMDSPKNFSALSCHRLIPPAMEFLLNDAGIQSSAKVDGFIDPGHVSVIIGVEPYESLSSRYKIPQVISGFEPLDVLFGVLRLLEMIKDADYSVVNNYPRVVKYNGNPKAKHILNEVFETIDVKWRGFPLIPKSGLEIRDEFACHDARKKFVISVESDEVSTGCRCSDILKGIIYPMECPLFKTKCTPENPVGPCMVSSEGACMIAYKYKKII